MPIMTTASSTSASHKSTPSSSSTHLNSSHATAHTDKDKGKDKGKEKGTFAITSTQISSDKLDLPKLISQYGDASSTSWLEGRYAIWRGEHHSRDTPRVQGYLPAGHFCIAWGMPLAKKDDLRGTAEEFVRWCKQHHKKPVWACVDHDLEEILAEGVEGDKWNTISCIKEDVLHPDNVDLDKKEIKANRKKAMKERVVVDEIKVKGPDFVPPPEIKKEIEDGLEAWRLARTGTQIASSALLPWLDGRHRRYFIAKAPSGIVGVCILAPIAHNSYQVKNSISFPNAPRGTSEDLLGEVIEQMQAEGRNSLTFGTSAADDITFEAGIKTGNWRIKMLSKIYRHIIKKHHLAERGQFRHKFDTEDEPLYVCFPPGGFGLDGIYSLMRMLRTK